MEEPIATQSTAYAAAGLVVSCIGLVAYATIDC